MKATKLLIAAILFLSPCVAQLPKTDTIKVILLVSDIDGPTPLAYTMKAYSVRDRHNRNEESNGDWYCGNCKDYMKHSYYLDEKKRLLSKKIRVWQSSELTTND